MVCLADGRLLWHSRAYPVRLQAISTNGGETWSTPTPGSDLPDPSDNGSVARFDGRPQVDLAPAETDTWLTPGRPDTWQHVGDFHVVPTAVEGVDRRAWKEVGQAYGAEGQVIGTRESQYLNYGPPRPGYRAGDLLTFAGRVRNTGDEPLVVELTGPAMPAETELEPGQEFVLDASYQVTAADIARGEVVVDFTASAGGVDQRTTHRFDTETGAVQVV